MTTGDGQLTAVQLLSALKKSGKKLSELASLMKVYPQVMRNLRADKEMKKMVKIDAGVLRRQEELEKQMKRQRPHPGSSIGHRAGYPRHGRGTGDRADRTHRRRYGTDNRRKVRL